MRLFPIGLLSLALVGGCSGNNDNNMGAPDLGSVPDLLPAGPDLNDGEPSTNYPAPHPAPPQATDNGGPLLMTPTVVPVYFANDVMADRTELEAFVAALGASSYWHDTTAEYGIGALTAAAPVELTETATATTPGTIDDSTIQTWLQTKLDTNDAMFPTATANMIFALQYPAGVNITLGGAQGEVSCNSFGGYHSSITLDTAHGSINVAYAVIPRCPPLGFTTMELTTSALAHELIEAVTDPLPNINSAYLSVDQAHRYWSRAIGGGEIADLCEDDAASFYTDTTLNEMVQRVWSNASAMAGHDPCVPIPAGEVYFATVPELPDTITTTGMSGNTTMQQGVHIPVGTTRTIALDFFSDGPTSGPWTVKVEDVAQIMGGASAFTFALDRDSGVNGEKAQLTITTNTAGTRGTGTFAVTAKLGTVSHRWYGLVGEK